MRVCQAGLACMASNFLTQIFGSRNDRLLKTYRKSIERIAALETGLEKLDAALDEAPHDHAHGGAHGGAHADAHHDAHAPGHPVGHDDDHETHDVEASGSTVVIERARHVVIHAPAPTPAPTPAHDKPKPLPTEAERRQAIRQAVSDLNDHWRLKEARIAEIEAAHRELSAPRR